MNKQHNSYFIAVRVYLVDLSVPMDVPLKVAWSGKARYTPNHTASKHVVIIPWEVGGRTDLVQILYAKKHFSLLLYHSKQSIFRPFSSSAFLSVTISK